MKTKEKERESERERAKERKWKRTITNYRHHSTILYIHYDVA